MKLALSQPIKVIDPSLHDINYYCIKKLIGLRERYGFSMDWCSKVLIWNKVSIMDQGISNNLIIFMLAKVMIFNFFLELWFFCFHEWLTKNY